MQHNRGSQILVSLYDLATVQCYINREWCLKQRSLKRVFHFILKKVSVLTTLFGTRSHDFDRLQYKKWVLKVRHRGVKIWLLHAKTTNPQPDSFPLAWSYLEKFELRQGGHFLWWEPMSFPCWEGTHNSKVKTRYFNKRCKFINIVTQKVDLGAFRHGKP